jgi:hypothetical protein
VTSGERGTITVHNGKRERTDMTDDGDRDYVNLGLEDAAAVDAITRTTGINKAKVLAMLVRKGIGRPAASAWERRVYRVIDETAQQLDDHEPEERSA